jgi:L-ascorbate metabolism protein UlaG (beta-lactamase superfamily)
MATQLTHIGGPTVLIETGGWRLLTDPTFDPAGGTYRFGWGTGSRKVAGPALQANELGPIDAVLLSHDQHDDNLDASGRDLLASVPLVITTPPGAKRLGSGTRGLEDWETTKIESEGRAPLEITATPCRHGAPVIDRLSGAVIGFSLNGEDQTEGELWISGDTVLYDGVRQVADRLKIDTALLHLGGVRFPVTGPLRYTMTAADAIELCEAIRPRVAIPIHYEGWRHFREGRADVERELAKAPAEVRESFRWLPVGEPTTV